MALRAKRLGQVNQQVIEVILLALIVAGILLAALDHYDAGPKRSTCG